MLALYHLYLLSQHSRFFEAEKKRQWIFWFLPTQLWAKEWEKDIRGVPESSEREDGEVRHSRNVMSEGGKRDRTEKNPPPTGEGPQWWQRDHLHPPQFWYQEKGGNRQQMHKDVLTKSLKPEKVDLSSEEESKLQEKKKKKKSEIVDLKKKKFRKLDVMGHTNGSTRTKGVKWHKLSTSLTNSW